MKYQHFILLPFALALIIVGLVLLLLWGIGNLGQYNHTKDFTTATCTVVYSHRSGYALCDHLDIETNDNQSAKGFPVRYPCLIIYVNYTETIAPTDPPDESLPNPDNVTERPITRQKKNEVVISRDRVMLYDTVKSWLVQKSGEANTTCSMHVCDEDSREEDSVEEVQKFYERFGQPSESFQCFFNPSNQEEVYAHVVNQNNIVHALVWPALAMGFGFFLLVVFIFQSCEVWVCRNPKILERRNQGQTYHLAYRQNHVEFHESGRRSPRPGSSRQGSGSNNPNTSKSRLPKLSAAADIVRKFSFRNRNSGEDADRSVGTTRSFGGVPSRQWSFRTEKKHFSTT